MEVEQHKALESHRNGPVGAFQYRTVDTSTLKGLREAERLHNRGWRSISVGLFRIQFERPKISKKRN